jgi:type 1 glutamine amidotransferase
MRARRLASVLRAGILVALGACAGAQSLQACTSPDTEIPGAGDVAAGDASGGDGTLSADAPLDGPLGCKTSSLDTPARPLRILFFTRETFYYHPGAHMQGDTLVSNYLRARGHQVIVSGDPASFTPASLARFDVIVFFVTSGTVFDDDSQRAALQAFVESGRGIVGTHTATATEQNWDFFQRMFGAFFYGHGVGDAQITQASLLVTDASSPLVSFLPSPWTRTDEWYYFLTNPADNPALHELLRLDESTLPDAGYPDVGFYAPKDHPLAWTQDYRCARVFYTALGHTGDSYSEELVLRHIALGTEWAGAPSSEQRP